MLVYKFTYDGMTVFAKDAFQLLNVIQLELAAIGEYIDVKSKIVFAVMTQQEINALPEFEGF